MQEAIFKNKSAIKFPGFTEQVLLACQSKLWSLGLSQQQISEAASYSMAMVVRYALGLSGEDSRIAILACDSLAGQIALATARHLINSGATAEIILPPQSTKLSEDLQRQIKPLQSMRATFHTADPISSENTLNGELLMQVVGSCHNLIWGSYGSAASSWLPSLVEKMNDLSTPVHCIQCPPGINPNSGAVESDPLYASSTLSLGAPLTGLFYGSDYAGRHYLCDVSYTSEIYTAAGFDLSPLFAEQPVIQIFAEKVDE